MASTPWTTTELLAYWDRLQERKAWRTDPLTFATALFPHHFTRTSAQMHAEMVALAFPRVEEFTSTETPSTSRSPAPTPPPKSDTADGH